MSAKTVALQTGHLEVDIAFDAIHLQPSVRFQKAVSSFKKGDALTCSKTGAHRRWLLAESPRIEVSRIFYTGTG